ncbi:hypothetical protein JVT61DRAFT_5360 [Boletus reticuloceps]|uniref:Uncharacterized protein n=1 Tax=Boletus reticuloceps TaxID=495285 RepID=A0A8I2YYD4_9AGAM|nr:hypothetical protein JVT61DRAFT_5360 [Boletus reticuloceps]
MFMTIALLCLLCLLLALILLRSPPAVSPPPHVIPVPPPRHVSFSLVSSDSSYSLPTSPAHRRWSSPFHKRKSSPPDSPDIPVDQFGRILASSPASEMLPSPKPSRRLSTSLHLSFTGKRRSSSVSCTSTLIHLDQVDARASLPSTPATRSPPQRTRFVNPFSKRSRSRTLSPPSNNTALLSSPSGMSIPSSPRRRTLVNKFKSIFKSTSPEPSPIIQRKPILTTTNTRLRRKPVARTQPYGPPWNAPMPVPDFTLSQHPLRESAHQSFRKSMSPGQLSPRTFISELDEKLSLLQQQHIQDSITSCSFI